MSSFKVFVDLKPNISLSEYNNKQSMGRPSKRWTDLVKMDTGLLVSTVEKYTKNHVKFSLKGCAEN